MSRRGALAVAAALTAFVLVVVGAVASRSMSSPTVPVAPTTSGEVVPLIVVQAREAELNRRLEDAQARLHTQEKILVEARASTAKPPSVQLAQAHEADESEAEEREEHEGEHHHDDD
jgi:hypothetical protein